MSSWWSVLDAVQPENEGPIANDESIADESSSSEGVFEDANEEIALPPQQERLADTEHESRRSGRERLVPGKYKDYITYNTRTGKNVPKQLTTDGTLDIKKMSDPFTYDEALSRPDRELGIAALETNETRTLEDLPEGGKAIKNKWVFKTKRGADGEIMRYKARLVV